MSDHKTQVQRWRERVKVTNLIERLQKHVNGEIELTATQINAARLLLGKAMPDLKAVEHTGTLELNDARDAHQYTDAELESFLDAIRGNHHAGTAAEAESKDEPGRVH